MILTIGYVAGVRFPRLSCDAMTLIFALVFVVVASLLPPLPLARFSAECESNTLRRTRNEEEREEEE